MLEDRFKPKRLLAATALLVGGAAMFLGAPPTTAQDLSGPTDTGDDLCMQQVFGGETVNNANRLNCTANDVSLARAVEVSPETCIAGETFTLTATFEVNVTASERYDPGFFFRIDGGADARDPDGTCSLSALDPSLNPSDPITSGENLDGDTCGDLTSGSYLATFEIPGVKCEGVPDPDNPGQLILRLPNCTSWHSNARTTCNLTTDGEIGNAGDFAPETKSKCACDDTFTVPVVVEDATLTVIKTAGDDTVGEPGGTVTYTVQVTNESEFVSVTLTTVFDDPYDDLTDPNNDQIANSTCGDLVDVVLGPGDTDSCTFEASVSGNAGDEIPDLVEVCGDQEITGEEVCGEGEEIVTITDVQTEPDLAKTALGAGCTVDVNYQVVVTNNSEVDVLTVDSLIDDPFGDITQVQGDVRRTTCATGGTIAPLGNYTCNFLGRIESANCSIDETDTVTGTVTDDDDVTFTPSDSATVKVITTFP